MKPRTLVLLVVGALALLAALFGLLRRPDPASRTLLTSPGDVEPRAPAATRGLDSGTATSVEQPTLQSPAQEVEASPRSAGAAPGGPRNGAKIVFRHDSGAPAAGLALRRGDELVNDAREGVEPRAPDWRLHLDGQGALDLEQARTLGSVVAVRLGEHVVELLAFDPEHVREYELATLVDQDFVLQGVPGGRDGKLVISLYSDALWRLSNASEVTHRTSPGAFANTWTVHVASATSPIVVAHLQLELSRAHPSVRARLPRGALHFELLKNPAGWRAALGRDVVVDGNPIAIPVRAVPVVEARLGRDETGAPVAPQSVHLLSAVAARDGLAASSAEIALDFEIDGDVLIVGLAHRERDEHGVTYALVFHWSDGATTSTGPGDWSSLAAPLEFGPGRVPRIR